MKALRRHRYLPAVVVLSLVFKMLLAGLHAPMAMAGVADDAQYSASSGVIQFVICTPSGLRSVALDGSGKPIDGSDEPLASDACTLCSLLNAGSTTLVATTVDVAPIGYVAYRYALKRDGPCRPSILRSARGYDPPRL